MDKLEGSPSTVSQPRILNNWRWIEQVRGSLRLPARCRLCLGAGGELGICADCLADLPWWGRTRIPVPRYCADAIVAFAYREPVKSLILKAKYQRDAGCCQILGELLGQLLKDSDKGPDILVPIPMPWPRLLWRGQNHADLIAQAVGKKTGIPVRGHTLCRRGWQRPQKGLSRSARLTNLRSAFGVDQGVRGAQVGLIDDVLTTGATLQSAAKVLIAHGASRVIALTVAFSSGASERTVGN